MILRNTNNREYNLHKEITVGEFIKEIIENDNDKNLKCKNMILYYQDGILKSQHTTGCKMDYSDYLNHQIVKTYGADYIGLDNIKEFDKDHDGEDANKPPKIINTKLSKEEVDEICQDVLKEFSDKFEKDRIINKIRWVHLRENINFDDLVECVAVLIEKFEDNYYEQNCKRSKIEELQVYNKVLQAQVKWLEYKMDLLLNTNNNEAEYDNFNPKKFEYK